MNRHRLNNRDVEASLVRMRRGIQRADVPDGLSHRLHALPTSIDHDEPEALEIVSDSRIDSDRPAVRGPALATSYLLSYAGATFDVAIDVVRSSETSPAELRGVIIGTSASKEPHRIIIGDERISTDSSGQFRVANVDEGDHVLRIAGPRGRSLATVSITID